MTHIFKDTGVSVPLTIIQVYENCVLDFKLNENEEFDSLLVAFKKASDVKKLSKPHIGVFNKKSLPLFEKILGSQVKKGLFLKTGDSFSVDSIFKEGDKISVRGTSIGKGFAGAMKRWNFGGLEATHGVSVSHRSHGSTGQRQDPGKTFKGKKMAGHMGTDAITVKNLEIAIVDREKSIIAVKGAVPGNAGNDVVLKIIQNF